MISCWVCLLVQKEVCYSVIIYFVLLPLHDALFCTVMLRHNKAVPNIWTDEFECDSGSREILLNVPTELGGSGEMALNPPPLLPPTLYEMEFVMLTYLTGML